MWAWRFTGVDEPLLLCEVDAPRAAEGWVVVEVRATGLCQSDVGFLRGKIDHLLGAVPITLGHEFAGIVSEVGVGVEGVNVGDRVGVAGVSGSVAGVQWDGGYAQFAAAPADRLVPIPRPVSFEQAAVGTDAGATSYNAVHVSARVAPGQRVGIIGLGGLGMIGARLAVIAGAEVVGVDVNESVFDQARDLGVRSCATDIRDFADRDLDTIIDFAGMGTTTAAAIESVRRDGRVVQVGLGKPEATISTTTLVSKHVVLVGSSTATPRNVEGVYGLMATGELVPEIHTIGFRDIADGLGRLERGEVTGRLVALLA